MIKDDHGNAFMEIPLSVATGVIAAPVLAAVGTVVTLISQFTVVVERADQKNESAGVQKLSPSPLEFQEAETDRMKMKPQPKANGKAKAARASNPVAIEAEDYRWPPSPSGIETTSTRS
jgi:hypothetical protein